MVVLLFGARDIRARQKEGRVRDAEGGRQVHAARAWRPRRMLRGTLRLNPGCREAA
jgi:hypothetical protein